MKADLKWEDIMPGGPLEEPQLPQSTTLQTVASLVAALAAVFAVVSQSKPLLAWTLVVVALLLIGLNFYKPLIARLKAKRKQAAEDKAARSYYSELLRFVRRFEKFVSVSSPHNIRTILASFCANNEELAKFSPDYMREIFPPFIMRHEQRTSTDAAEFCISVHELFHLVTPYNTDYVLEPFKRFRAGQWPANLTESARQELERRIEDFRERWVGFLDDLSEFLEGLNDPFPNRALPAYFERPQKL